MAISKLATLVEGNPKVPFSIATTPRFRGGCYSIPWIAPLYPWFLPYSTECLARQHQVPFFESLVWLDLGLNPSLLDHWRTLYSLGQWSGHNDLETTKNICCVKDEGAVDHATVTRWLQSFCSGCKNLDNQAKSGRPKTVNPGAVLQAIEANTASSTQRVSSELSLLQSSIVDHIHNLSKNIWSCWIVSHVAKILQNFWLTLEF